MKFLAILTSLLTSGAAFAQDAATSATAAGTDAAAAGQQPGITSLVFQLGIIFAIFYFLLIRPQNKKHKEHLQMIASLEKGDKVVTGGGIVGIVSKVEEKSKFIEVEIASGLKVEVLRSSVSELVESKNKPVAKTAEKPAKK